MSTQIKKHSHASRGRRRSHLALTLKNLVACRHCQARKLPHHLCAKCKKY